MSNKIYIKGKITGGLGNQLFQLHLLEQMSRKFNLIPIYPENEAAWSFKGFQAHRRFLPQLKKSSHLDTQIIQNDSTEAIELLIHSILKKNRNLSLPHSVLGEALHKFCFFELNHLFRPKAEFDALASEKNSNNIALHFRGKDFLDWDKTAIMSPDFYFEALSTIKNLKSKSIVIFTDDPGHETIRHLRQELSGSLIVSSQNYHFDFWRLSTFGTLISSPSTFAMWAGMLGQRTHLILRKSWLEERIEKQETYWMNVAQNVGGLYERVTFA